MSQFVHFLLSLIIFFTLSLAVSTHPTNELNIIDTCWRKNPNWASKRIALARCAKGYGQAAYGEKNASKVYVVTSNEDDPINPQVGTLRHAIIQWEPLWIIFEKSMVIRPKLELVINSFKYIDGRGVNVEITGGPCLTIRRVTNVIVHGINIHGCTKGEGRVRIDPIHVVNSSSDGCAIAVLGSSKIWIDHCDFSNCYDGLIDAIRGSTNITISNNKFYQHDKVMLLGHNDGFKADIGMRVTIMYNNFGAGLVQRMPRVRFGYAHVANNMYYKWANYAIGGSANPTIFSEGNYFIAPDKNGIKQVTKRAHKKNEDWKSWTWKSKKDMFLNGAYFLESGKGNYLPEYSSVQSFSVADGKKVPQLTAYAGVLPCVIGLAC